MWFHFANKIPCRLLSCLSFYSVIFYSPNRFTWFTCMGFLLLSKGCVPGPHDFAFVSGLAFHWVLWPHALAAQGEKQMGRKQVGDKCQIMRPRPPRAGNKWEASVKSRGPKQVWETSVKSCGPDHPEWETSVGDKWQTSVKACGPEHPEWDPEWGTSGRQAGNTRNSMRPRARRVGDKRETSGRHVILDLSPTCLPLWVLWAA